LKGLCFLKIKKGKCGYLGFRLPWALSDAFSETTLRNGAQRNKRFWKNSDLIGKEKCAEFE